MIFRLSNRLIGNLLSPKCVYCYSTGTAAPQPSVLANYLIDSLGFDKQEALDATKKVICYNSFRNDPNLVINFLKEELGLDKSQIKSIVSCSPSVLVANVDKTLRPKIKVLQDIRLSGSDLVKVLMSYRSLLVRPLRSQILPPIEYLRNLLGSNELVGKAVLKCSTLLHWSAPRTLAPNVLFLKELGISENVLARIMIRCATMLLRKPPSLEKFAEMVETEYKVTRDSKMIPVMAVVYSYGKAAIGRKFNIFRSFGWSEENIHLLFRRFPSTLSYSEARLQKVVEFYMTEVGCEIDYLARNPMLFNFSFEKRVKPRHRVRKILLEKGLIKAKLGVYYMMSISEPRFLKRFVLPYMDESTLSLTDVEFLKNYVSSHNCEMTSLYALDVKSVGRKKKLGKT